MMGCAHSPALLSIDMAAAGHLAQLEAGTCWLWMLVGSASHAGSPVKGAEAAGDLASSW